MFHFLTSQLSYTAVWKHHKDWLKRLLLLFRDLGVSMGMDRGVIVIIFSVTYEPESLSIDLHYLILHLGME